VGHPRAAYPHDESHLAMTYTALCCLRILGDITFSRVNRSAIIRALPHLQRPDGSFTGTRTVAESDMRFLYAACAVSSLLDDWSGIDVERAVKFIRDSQSYDGGFGLWPGGEGHGGSTYCAVAALVLLKQSVDQTSCTAVGCMFL
jgi:geranylgeranyl transferase type-1 subunit beta